MRKNTFRFLLVLLAMVLCVSVAVFAADVQTVKIPVDVSVEGPVLDSDDTFTVEISAQTDGAPMPETPTLALKGGESGEFVMEYTDLGVYSYTIKQIPGDNKDCTYDGTEYTLTVYVTVEDGKVGTQAVLNDGGEEKPASASFTNTYADPDPAKLDPPVEKAVEVKNGTAPEDSVFTFAMIPGQADAPMPDNSEARLDEETGALYMDQKGPGSYEFGWMYYDADDVGKTYTYTIKEVPGEDSNYTYDAQIYTMTVVVTSKDRQITLDVTYSDADGKNANMAKFTNIYDSGEVTPSPSPSVKPSPSPSVKPSPTPSPKPSTPKTGDNTNIALWIGLLLISGIGLCVALVLSKKKRA